MIVHFMPFVLSALALLVPLWIYQSAQPADHFVMNTTHQISYSNYLLLIGRDETTFERWDQFEQLEEYSELAPFTAG